MLTAQATKNLRSSAILGLLVFTACGGHTLEAGSNDAGTRPGAASSGAP